MSRIKGWVSGPRASVGVYGVKQLQEIARKEGIDERRLNKRELSKKLNIPWIEKPKKKRPDEKKEPPTKKKSTTKKKTPTKKKSTTKKKTPTKKKSTTKKSTTKKSTTKSQESTKEVVQKEMILVGGKNCNVGRSSIQKSLLNELAVEYLGYTPSTAKSINKDVLCKELATKNIPNHLVYFGSPLKKETVKPPKKDVKKTLSEKKKSETKEKKRLLEEKENELRLLKDIKEAEEFRRRTPPTPKVSGNACITESKLKLHPHQKELVEYLRKHRGAVAALGVGTGKTLLAVASAQCALADDPTIKIIIVTPPGLKKNIEDTLDKYGVTRKHKKSYTFYSYTMFAKEYAGNVEKFPKNAYLIIDEAHKIKKNLNPMVSFGGKVKESSLARVAVECGKKAKKVLLLTATPRPNSDVDIINLAAMVRGESELTEKQFSDIKANKKLFDAYMSCVFYFYSQEKGEDFPKEEIHYKHIPMDKEYYKEYMKIEQKELSVKGAVSASGEIKTAFYNNIRQATNSISPNPKIEFTIKLIKKGKKTVVYSEFIETGINKLKERLDQERIKYGEINGSVNAAKRNVITTKFNNASSGMNVLLISKAGGEGLDLKGVRIVVLLEKGWTRANEEQVIGRAIRYKSHAHLPEKERKVDVYHLLLEKPSLIKRKEWYGKVDLKPSADEILQKIVHEKGKGTIILEDELKKVGIGGKYCKTNKMKGKVDILRALMESKAVAAKKHKGNAIIPKKSPKK